MLFAGALVVHQQNWKDDAWCSTLLQFTLLCSMFAFILVTVLKARDAKLSRTESANSTKDAFEMFARAGSLCVRPSSPLPGDVNHRKCPSLFICVVHFRNFANRLVGRSADC
eukprot:COSAG05_NODE_1500_length_4702_cov_7.352813_4_plen_112_part_00